MEKKKKIIAKLSLVLFLTAQFYGMVMFAPKRLEAGTPTDAKDTLSTSRLSYSGLVSGTHIAGSTAVTTKTSGAPDLDTTHLFVGDTVKIGPNSTKSVGSILGANQFTITAPLSLALVDGDLVIATQSAIHTVTFTTASSLTNGIVRVKIPSATSNNNDGLPDQTGFDFNAIATGNLTCPTAGLTGGAWQAPTASASGSNGCTSGYSCFECKFSGTLAASTAETFIIGNSTISLINPSAASGHVAGTADLYTPIIEVRDLPNANLIDSISLKLAVIESVQVSATVDPTFTFSVALVGATQANRCGLTTSVASTVSTIPFGTLSANTFKQAAQTLTVSTNANSGYVVTIEEDNQMSVNGAGVTEITDSQGDDGTGSHLVRANWTTATATVSTAYGLGYSLENVPTTGGTDATFEYDDFQTFLMKSLPCTSAAGTCGTQDTVQTIMSNATSVNASSIYVCYRIDVSGTQAAGTYFNKVMYIASPQFN